MALSWLSMNLTDDESIMVPSNGLEPSANKPLAEAMLTQSYVVICHQKAAID